MRRTRPWVVAGARGAVAWVLAMGLSASGYRHDLSPERFERAITAAGATVGPAPVVDVAVAVEAPPPPIVWPVPGALTSVFGERRESHRHKGVDLHAPSGSRVVAAAAGTVVHAGPAPSGYGGYGTVVIIDHGDGIATIYAHLSKASVRRGTPVGPGDPVGAAGSTGQSAEPHLHFEVRRDGTPIDPRHWLPPR